MTDERMGDALWEALERLPRGSGVVFRHYGVPSAQRRALFDRVARTARRRRLILVCAGDPMGRADGTHGRRGPGLTTFGAHSRCEAIRAIQQGADALFVSPVFPTRSHPRAKALGRSRFGMIVRGLNVPIIALGGMNARRAASLRGFGIHGWAAIDAWSASGQQA